MITLDNLTEKILKEKVAIPFSGKNDIGHIQYWDRANNFSIFFNGKCIYTSKTFKAFKKRVERLFKTYSLSFDND